MAIKRLYDTLVGATVGWNQLVKARTHSITANGVTVTENGDGSITLNGTSTSSGVLDNLPSITQTVNHVYYLAVSGSSMRLGYSSIGGNASFTQTIKRSTASGTASVSVRSDANVTYNDLTISIVCIDLTAYFGSASIADYLYNLETATAGAGIAKLKEWGFFTGDYIPYNPGSLESVEARSHVLRGFNQWDEEWESGYFDTSGNPVANSSICRSKNFIPIVPNTAYFYKSNGQNHTFVYYDADKNFIRLDTAGGGNSAITTPSNAHYMKIAWVGTTYNHDICINLSSDRNGEYEPCVSHTYDLGTDTLRGLFKLDSNNNLYADGDTKASDGTITRYYGTRAYQSGDESLADAITDGTTTVYKLTTPTTEQSTPFTNPQICDPDGTEEYVTNNGIPVGHETRYQL